MFEFIRTHQRLMQFMLLLIIVPAFAIGFGLQGWNINGDPNLVAKVCGLPVSTQDFERAQQEYLNNMRQQLGANFRPEFFDNPEARGAILDRLVNLVDEALRGPLFERPSGLASSDVTVADPAVGTGTFLLGVLRRIAETVALLNAESA